MPCRNRRLTLLGLAVPLLAAGCGAGVAGVAASSGSSGGGNSAPSIANLQVPVSRTSPARIHFELADREGETVRVELRARVPDDQGNLGAPELLTQLDSADFPANGAAVAIPAGGQGKTIDVAWDFSAETFLAGSRFVEGLQLAARLDNGTELVLGDDEPLSIGNDAPQVTAVTPIVDADEGEVAGIVRVEVSVADSSDDVVTVAAEFDVQGDAPDAGWKPATGFGLTDVQVLRAGTTLDFFWDTDADLHDLERQVALRCTATDSALAAGNTLESLSFRVDNNAAPIVQLDSGPLILNPDERRGIPIPFRVIDEEGDLVEVIFQWRREGEEFPSLDRDGNGTVESAEVDAILADPVLRQEHHVCTEYPHYAKGRVVPIDENTVRLPELASSESWTLASGIEGRTLELLRPSSIPAPITPTWPSNPLISPIAALPVGDGLTALVLDIPGNGRLREIEIATGTIVREITVFGAGIPSTMAFERDEKAVLVALDDAGTWRIERVQLASGVRTELAVSDGTHAAPVRGVASLGRAALVFTVGSTLVHLDYRDAATPRVGTLLEGLETPWGVAVDPLSAERALVAERDANRVVSIELDALDRLPVVVRTSDLQPGTLQAPRALALERSGARLLIVTAGVAGDQLTGLDPGVSGENRSFAVGAPLATSAESLFTGQDGLRLLCLPAENEILVAGGVEQRRTILSHSSGKQEVSVERPFAPAPRPGVVWRLAEQGRVRASSSGTTGRFLWNSADVHSGPVLLRALARDDELGATSEGTAPKRVRKGVERVLGGHGLTDKSAAVAAADLDGDGDLDLASANLDGDDLSIFFQLSRGVFSSLPLTLGGSAVMDRPVSIAAADLDADGDLDLVSANQSSNDLTVLHQLSPPGNFATTPLVLGGSPQPAGPRSLAAADLDSDGDQDLVAANGNHHGLSMYFQLAGGVLADPPFVLGDITTARDTDSVAAADLDGDGDLDLASANPGGPDLIVFFQTSRGTFAATPFALGGKGTTDQPFSIVAGDLDGDGDQDLVSARTSTTPAFGHDLILYFQTSPGTFPEPPLILGERTTPRFLLQVVSGDLDGDGDEDLISVNAQSGLTAYFQLGQGTFASPIELERTTGTRLLSAMVADLDADGAPDLVSTDLDTSTLRVSLTSPSESWPREPVRLTSFPSTLNIAALCAADFDGDGDRDLASGSLTGHFDLFFQTSIGEFAETPLTLAERRFPTSVVGGDLDGDGDQDAVSANSSEQDLTAFLQRSPGAFPDPPLTLGGPGVLDLPSAVALSDLDGDGAMDIVSANNSDLAIFLQLAPGSFAIDPTRLDVPATTQPASVVAADLDEDGDLDLVSANYGSNDLTVFRQLSPGNFALDPLPLGGPGVTSSPNALVAADVDQDGRLDLLSANGGNEDLTLFLQGPSGGFVSPPLVLGGPTTTRGPSSLAVADLDGDGDPDVVSANALGNDLTVFLQLAPGTFARAPLVLGGPGTTDLPNEILAVDLDGDGDADLATANDAGGDITIFFSGR